MAPMIRGASLVILAGVVFAGCTATKKAAVTTFHVIDAPANYVRHKIDEPQTTTTTTTTSDVVNPGYAVTQSTPPPRVVTTQRRTTTPTVPSPSEGPRKVTAAPSSRPAATSQSTQFPVARPVPGRPGYVYSIDPNGGIIDVTSYKPGDKAKDPYTKQIFIVP